MPAIIFVMSFCHNIAVFQFEYPGSSLQCHVHSVMIFQLFSIPADFLTFVISINKYEIDFIIHMYRKLIVYET